MFNIATAIVPHREKSRNLDSFVLFVILASLLFLLPLQGPGSPHASVGDPLDGQKVKLSPFFSSQPPPLSVSTCSSLFTCVAAFTAVH